jgi:hypothetical protein
MGLSFANPFFLFGLISLGIPIYLHLYYRKTPILMDFPSLRLIRSSVEAIIRRMKIRNLVLLALRLLVLAFLIGALAKPFLGRGTFMGSGVPMAFVVVLDNSLSMNTSYQGVSMFNNAKARALEIIDQMGPDDKAAVALLNDPGSVLLSQLSWDKSALKEAIRNVSPGMRGTNLYSSLLAPLKMLSEVQSYKRTLYVITDMTKSAWDPFLDNYDIENMAPGVDLVLVPIGDRPMANLAVSELKQETPLIMAGRTGKISTIVSNFSPNPVSTKLSVYVDNEKKNELPVALEAGARQRVEVDCSFPRAGFSHVRVALPSDALVHDDERHLAVRVLAPLKMLIIKPEGARPGQESRDDVFLRFALNPMNRPKGSNFIVENRTAVEALQVDLEPFTAVFLVNQRQLPGELPARISDYVMTGGNLVIFPGNQTDPEWHNKHLIDDLGGRYVMPARLFKRVGNSVSRNIAYQLTDIDFGHSAFSVFQGEDRGDPSRSKIYEFFQVRPNPMAMILARMSHGLPAIVEERRGEGRAMLVTFPADNSWSDWVLKPTFLPFLHQAIIGMVSGDGLSRKSLLPGTPFSMMIHGENVTRAELISPDGFTNDLPIRKEGENLVHFSTTSTEQLGIYRIRIHGDAETRIIAFTVNPPPVESDLTKIPVSQVPRFISIDHKAGSEVSLGEKVMVTRQGRELATFFLWLLLILLVVETVAANIPIVGVAKAK